MDVPSAADDEPNPEVPDFVPDDLDLSCSWCKVETGARWDAASKQILCKSCVWQWPLIFKSSNDPSKT